MSEQRPPEMTLQAMSPEEFATWVEVFTDEYAEELVERLGIDQVSADELARQELAEVLPDGFATTGARLRLVVASDGSCVGALWWGLHPRRPDAAYVFQIVIDEGSRRRGYGRSAMLAAEVEARAAGYLALGLAVTGGNLAARRLYDRLGYRVQSISMLKVLTDR